MARPKVSKRIGNYGNDFKVKAVRLTFIEGTQVQEVARALDIHPFMLSRWRKEYREGEIVRLLEQTEIDKKLLSDNLTKHGLKEKFENFTGER